MKSYSIINWKKKENFKYWVIPDNEKEYWISSIINPKDQLTVTAAQWLEGFRGYLCNFPTAWTLIELNERIPSHYADLWIESHGEWHHSGGPHNSLGMAYAWWATEDWKCIDEISLVDSPDIIGSIGEKRVRGDIGKCSPMALLEGIRELWHHCLWITVLGWRTQLLIEFNYDIAFYCAESVGRAFMPKPWSESDIKEVFFCRDCQEWTITKKSRDAIARKWKVYKQPDNFQLSLPGM